MKTSAPEPREAALAPPRADGYVFAVSLSEPSRPHPTHAGLTTIGRCSAFLEGVLHDREELADAVGANARERADVELLLLAYARWGAAGFGRLRGSFAFGLIDSARDEAYVARDPVGHRPFFRAEHGGHLLAATSQRALLAVPSISRDLNRALLADRLCHRWTHPEETCYAAIQRVPAGSHLRIARGRIDTVRHWDPAGPFLRRDAGELLEAFDGALWRAVDRPLSTSGLSGIFLSGGLDSISVAALAADHARSQDRSPPLALSVGFPDPSCDERPLQRAAAHQLGLPIDLLDFDDALTGHEGLLSAGLNLNAALDAPLLNGWSPLYLPLASRAANAGVRTILTGGGGDEWLTVSPYLTADMMRSGQLLALARFVRTWQRSSSSSGLAVARGMLWGFGARPLLGSAMSRIAPRAWDRNRLARALAADPTWISPDPVLRAAQSERASRNLCDPRPPSGFYAREMHAGLDHPLVLTEHEEYFRWGQLTGTVIFRPYWDPDLISLLYTTHPSQLDGDGRNKALVRRTLARRFPAIGFERQRKVYATDFFAEIMSREGPAISRRIGSLRTLGELGVVDAKRAWSMVELAFPGPYERTFPAWDLLNFESWVRCNL